MPRDAEVDNLIAKDSIRDLLARYCRAIDRCDPHLLESIYHPDAIDEHGLETDGSAAQFREIVFDLLRDSWESTQHFLGNILIDVDGDRAHGETYVVVYQVRAPDADGRRFIDMLGARYVDRFERRQGDWRIAHRIVVKDWQETRPFTDPANRPVELGRRDRMDATYRTAIPPRPRS